MNAQRKAHWKHYRRQRKAAVKMLVWVGRKGPKVVVKGGKQK